MFKHFFGIRSEGDVPLITLKDLYAKPIKARLLIAYTLYRNNPELTLLADDTDFESLNASQWLLPIDCPTIGLDSYRFKPEVWSDLKKLGSAFLTDEMLSLLKPYMKQKNAQYTWNW
ncbi:MAG: hypothetical protein IPG59_08095 [Candidatus Melainabacteria bacterium]|nr:MAG: hypothetical protein IPG59_08095 [Candidatus Melainabacteria bacterium]